MTEEVQAKAKVADFHGHRQRLRERFMRNELAGMLDYEKLELLLMFCIPRKDVKPIARKLLETFEDLPGVLDASHEALVKVSGVGASSAVMLRLIRALANDYMEARMRKRESLATQSEVVNFARMKLGAGRNETFMAIYLNSRLQVLAFDLTEGTVDRTVVYPRNVMRRCLETDATTLIVVHNHPTGVCLPSPQDHDLTRKLLDACKVHGISLCDHLIVSRTSFASILSMREYAGVAEESMEYRRL